MELKKEKSLNCSPSSYLHGFTAQGTCLGQPELEMTFVWRLLLTSLCSAVAADAVVPANVGHQDTALPHPSQ